VLRFRRRCCGTYYYKSRTGYRAVCEYLEDAWLVFRFVHSWAAAIITECVIITAVCTAVALWRGWIDSTLSGIGVYALIVLAIYAAVVFMLILRNRRDAEAITQQIQSE